LEVKTNSSASTIIYYLNITEQDLELLTTSKLTNRRQRRPAARGSSRPVDVVVCLQLHRDSLRLTDTDQLQLLQHRLNADSTQTDLPKQHAR